MKVFNTTGLCNPAKHYMVDIISLLLLLLVCTAAVHGQSLVTDGFTDASGSSQNLIEVSFHSEPGQILPLPRENYDAILSAVSEYVTEGKLSEEDYDKFCTSLTECTPKNPFHYPAAPLKINQNGTAVSFESIDLDGNAVQGEKLFAGHKITMLNVWDTTCAACITEMPALKELSRELAQKGGQLVGLVYNADEADIVEEAKEIAEDLDLNYINLLPSDELKALFPVQAFPTTFFFNEQGELLGEPIHGAQPKLYKVRLDNHLSE